LIAKDLRRMEIWAPVNEADIGQLKVGLPVRFRVDAFPKDTFHGKVSQIRLNANMTQNVVTYTVVISAENPDLKLLPYLTADVKFEVDVRRDVLVVPNAAVRWQPRPDQIAADAGSAQPQPRSHHGKRRRDAAVGDSGSASNQAASSSQEPVSETEQGRVWVAEGSLVRAIDVKLGASDGTFTEISGDGIREGMNVVVGQARADAAANSAANPFVPQFPRRRPRVRN
jgi:HlyD family secretion protein